LQGVFGHLALLGVEIDCVCGARVLLQVTEHIVEDAHNAVQVHRTPLLVPVHTQIVLDNHDGDALDLTETALCEVEVFVVECNKCECNKGVFVAQIFARPSSIIRSGCQK
jgi:hypothetical protein